MKINTISNQTFNGLTRTVNLDTFPLQSGQIHYRVINYYPFNDETASEVQKYVEKNEKLITCNKYPQFIVSTNINVKKALPFSKKEFAEYKNGSLIGELKELIGNSLVKNGLYLHLNETPYNKWLKRWLIKLGIGFFR